MIAPSVLVGLVDLGRVPTSLFDVQRDSIHQQRRRKN
jgi:hypothetical protein